MKHLTNVIIMITLMIFLTACQSSTDNQNDQVNKTDNSLKSVKFNIKDVNTNSAEYHSCFSDNFKSCTPVKCSFDGEFVAGQGRVQITKEIKGLKDDKCEVYQVYGVYESQPSFKNKSMTCLYPKYANGNDSYLVAECSGNLADLMQL